ncbi:PQQ-dependent sugar dehydrogenase [Massilia sp. CCM 9210]|uniref:PQQ-dependent sugar dehydrogenase n=1 Tax=Massilia scottii TaxID=3057166 RepID=UPI002796A3FC|nr:PQQ-dependent sugar dehydrogenase [Massilia sp. CCM 9210]MDQ1816593.1 PQQ-dependent sugar dehydrogenase [Massilia sp. CCM 9210]
MLTPHLRTILAALAMLLLSACGGSDDDKQPAGNGALTVNLANLPAGLPAAVRISGPASYAKTISAGQTLTGLKAGSYTVTADSILSGNLSWSAAAPVQSATVADGGTAVVNISYSSSTLALGVREVASVSGAVFLAAPAGDARQFIVERSGRILVMQDGALLGTPFLDIRNRVAATGEGGLLSMAFDPQYASNGWFFIYYTDAGNNIVVERHSVSSTNRNLAEPTAVLEIIRIPHPGATNHYGGLVSFGPDGFLYLATGDGGGAGDPNGNAQNLNVLLGKMLRLDVANSRGAQPYVIPPTNPFVGQAGRRAEIWASGLRNPWRYAFDADRLYIADVGQGKREEVDIAGISQGGLNYGWNIMEASLCYNAAICNKSGVTLPAFEYEHGPNKVNGCSITGGYVYRGKAIAELAGRYFYSDYCGGYLKSFLYKDNSVTEPASWSIPDIDAVLSFGQDGNGELYLIAATGKVYRIVRAGTS